MMVLNAFLPAGYPKSVTPDYLWYQIYVSEISLSHAAWSKQNSTFLRKEF